MITNCVCLVPAVLNMLSRDQIVGAKETQLKRYLTVFLDVLAIAAQLSGLFLWAINEYSIRGFNLSYSVWILPFALLLTSVGWWENYVDIASPFGMRIHQ